jgi:hypothetical protein
LGALIRVKRLIALAGVVACIARRLIIGVRINGEAKTDDQSSGRKKPTFATLLVRETKLFVFHGYRLLLRDVGTPLCVCDGQMAGAESPLGWQSSDKISPILRPR